MDNMLSSLLNFWSSSALYFFCLDVGFGDIFSGNTRSVDVPSVGSEVEGVYFVVTCEENNVT
jgi:hypothetical protein